MAVFSDGFESNDFTAWTGTGGTPTIQNAHTHHGHYAMEINLAVEYARIAVADNDTFHARTYFRLDDVPETGEMINLLTVTSTAWNDIVFVQILDNEFGFVRMYPDGGDLVAMNWATGVWYCAEIKAYRNDGAGEYRLYLDGVNVLSATGLDSSGIPAGWFCRFGNYNPGGENYTFQMDCCATDNAYIGLETFPMPVVAHHYRTINKVVRG